MARAFVLAVSGTDLALTIVVSSVIAFVFGWIVGAIIAVSAGWRTGRVWAGIVGGTLGALIGGAGTSVVATLIPALTGWPKDFFFGGHGPPAALLLVPLLAIVGAVVGAVAMSMSKVRKN